MSAELRKLTLDEYILLENLMEKVPDPNEIYTATGWHYELMALLGQFGYRPLGRIRRLEPGLEITGDGL